MGYGGCIQVSPKKLKLPPNIADTPRTREDFSKYLAEITHMDSQVERFLLSLKESEREEYSRSFQF